MPHGDAKHRAMRSTGRVKRVATLFNSPAIITSAAMLINPIASRQFGLAAEGTAFLPFAAPASQIMARDVIAFFDADAWTP